MIVAERLHRRFGKTIAVDDVSFHVAAGRVVGFLGPNGAGKTTTIRMITGALPPTQGHVRVGDARADTEPIEVARQIGYLPESAPLYTEMRVREFLTFRGRLYGLNRSECKAAVGKAVDRCLLSDVHKRPIHQLSKGYRQRVGLAAALLHDPPVLILDEPTVGLDPTQIRAVRSLIRDLAGDRTILLSTHILPEVELVCDEILMMARGKLRAAGTVDELRTRAARSSRYVIETSCDRARATVEAVSGVAVVDATVVSDEFVRLIVTARDDAGDLRIPIAQALASRSGVVRELAREAPSLEQLFEQIVSGTSAASSESSLRAPEGVTL